MTSTNGSPTTATVETITAEVHILQVGNRQITLSVVRQLDRVDYTELEPMGRVQSGRKDHRYEHESTTELIGRHRDTGALVFAYGPRHPRQPDATPEWKHWSMHTANHPDFPKTAQYRRVATDKVSGDSILWEVWSWAGICPLTNPHHDWPQRAYREWLEDSARKGYDPTEHWLAAEWNYRHLRGDFCDLPALWRQCWADANAALPGYVEAMTIHRQAEALPLIVLAGLR